MELSLNMFSFRTIASNYILAATALKMKNIITKNTSSREELISQRIVLKHLTQLVKKLIVMGSFCIRLTYCNVGTIL